MDGGAPPPLLFQRTLSDPGTASGRAAGTVAAAARGPRQTAKDSLRLPSLALPTARAALDVHAGPAPSVGAGDINEFFRRTQSSAAAVSTDCADASASLAGGGSLTARARGSEARPTWGGGPLTAREGKEKPRLQMKALVPSAVEQDRKTGFSRVPSAPVTPQEKETSLKRIAKGVYNGEEKRPGIPHGKGLLVTKTGHRFQGTWDNGEIHGTGMCHSPSGRTYSGEWSRGQITGKGMQTHSNGVVETGIFRNGRLHGYGEKVTPFDGAKFKGFFYDGLPEGEGAITHPNGDYFEGMWASGLPLEGKGRLTSGSSIAGGGIFMAARPAMVEGRWEYYGGLKTMKWHGKGQLWWSIGSANRKTLLWSYEGEFLDGKKHGHGCKSHVAEGWKYDGEWCRDEMTGAGKLTCPRREGDLRADVYEGAFKEGMPHGKCRYQRSDSQYQDGEWMRGQFLGGTCRLAFPNGASYEGECVGQKIHGLGTMKWPDGQQVTGVFENGYFPQQAHMQVSTTGSKPVSYEASFRGFLGTKLGLNARNGKLPRPARLQELQGAQLEGLQASMQSCSAGHNPIVSGSWFSSSFITSMLFPAPKVKTFKDIIGK